MKIVVTPIGSWLDAVNAARATVRAKPLTKEPSERLRRELLDAEHSPIRLVTFKIEMIDIPYWVSVHLVRHKIGVEHFVSTQRTDRTGTKRDDLPQGALVNHTMIANAQALINISHRRLCNTASPETHKVWQAVVNKLKAIDPIVAEFCVPMCVYRGGICHEHYSPCGKFPVMALNQTIKEN